MVQDAGSRLISAIRKQNEKTAYFCTAENLSPNVAVHEIRKSFKRIRALLHFFDEIPAPEIVSFKQAIKDFGRELSALRESSVNVQLFEQEIAGNQLIAERKLKKAREKLIDKNNNLLQEKFLEDGLCLKIQQLLADFNGYLRKVEKAPEKRQLYEQILLTHNKAGETYESLPPEQPAEEMHELRKNTKRLWYQLDFVRFLNARYFRMKTDQLNFISEYLGDDHDLHVFLQELKSNHLGFNSEEKQILENQVLHLRELNLVKLNPRLNQFFNEPSGTFENRIQKIFKVQ